MHFSLYVSTCYFVFFFFKQKTAYEMRISDWSSDVCSSDLQYEAPRPNEPRLMGAHYSRAARPVNAILAGFSASLHRRFRRFSRAWARGPDDSRRRESGAPSRPGDAAPADRKSVVSGTRVAVRVALGGGRIIQEKK